MNNSRMCVASQDIFTTDRSRNMNAFQMNRRSFPMGRCRQRVSALIAGNVTMRRYLLEGKSPSFHLPMPGKAVQIHAKVIQPDPGEIILRQHYVSPLGTPLGNDDLAGEGAGSAVLIATSSVMYHRRIKHVKTAGCSCFRASIYGAISEHS